MIDVLDELLVRLCACLDRKVGHVVPDRLHISLHEPIDLNECKEGVYGDASHV